MTDTDMRDCINHTMMFGCAAIVRKLGKKWVVEFRGHGFPNCFSTKREAMDRASEWVQMLSRKRAGLI